MKKIVAKIIKSGRTQMVCLPKEFSFKDEEVIIQKHGDDVILSPYKKSWESFFKETPLPSEDFMEKRKTLIPQIREDIF